MGVETNVLFDSIKNVFLKSMHENEDALNLPRADLFERIRTDIDIDNTENDDRLICEILEEKCRALAGFINKTNASIMEIGQNFSGEYFCSSLFVALETHYSYVELLQGKVPLFYKKIFRLLHNFLGNIYYYPNEKTVLNELFKYALYIYIMNPDSICSHSLVYERAKKRCVAIQSLNVDYEIVQDEIYLSERSLETVQKSIEDKIQNMDGFVFLDTLQRKALLPFYNKELDRYRLHRHKTNGINVVVPETPINFLIQLAFKTLKDSHFKKQQKIVAEVYYQDIIKKSQAFLTALNFTTDSMYEDILVDEIGLPNYLFNNMLYEAMVIPEQYNVNFLIDVMKAMFYPFRKEYLDANRSTYTYTIETYIRVARKILESNEHFFDLPKLKRLTRVNRKELASVLNNMSIDVKDVNKEFASILKMTNNKDYPLIKLDDNTYYFFEPRISGWSFYRNLYNILKLKIRDLNSKLGYQLENYIKKLLNSKNIPYLSGKYCVKKDQKEEVDIIIQNDNAICGIEAKYCFLNKDFEIGNDVSLLSTLGKGMIKAQEQLLKHRIDLIKGTLLELNDEHEQRKGLLAWENRRIISMSLCLPEYRFLTTKVLAEKLLNLLLICNVKLKDESRKIELDTLYKEQKKIQTLVESNIALLGNRVFFDSLFLSLQQLYMVIKMSKNVDEIISRIQNYISVHNAEMDNYELLLMFKS